MRRASSVLHILLAYCTRVTYAKNASKPAHRDFMHTTLISSSGTASPCHLPRWGRLIARIVSLPPMRVGASATRLQAISEVAREARRKECSGSERFCERNIRQRIRLCTLHSLSRLRRQVPLGGSLGAKQYASALVGGSLYRLAIKVYLCFRKNSTSAVIIIVFPTCR